MKRGKRKGWLKRISVFLLILSLTVSDSFVTVFAQEPEETASKNNEETVVEGNEKNEPQAFDESSAQGNEQVAVQADDEVITVDPGTTTDMELGQVYQMFCPAWTTNGYTFRFTPDENAGYFLEQENKIGNSNYELGITCYVLDEEEHLLARTSGYYMLEAGKTYIFDVEAVPNYRPMSAGGTLKMTRYGSWEECVNIEDGIATGLTERFQIVRLPDGVTGMRSNNNIYGLYTLILPSSIKDPVSTSDFWTATYRYITPDNTGRYIAEDGVLYDQIDQILRYVPSILSGSYTIREGTKSIEYHAFYGTQLEEIIFPDSVETIESYVFSNNSTIKRIKLSARIDNVEGNLFSSLYELEELDVSEESPYYESRDGILFDIRNKDRIALVFYPIGREGTAYTIPEDVTTLENRCFARSRRSYSEDNPVRNLKVLTIPETVTNVLSFLSDYCPEITIRGYEGSAVHKYWETLLKDTLPQVHWETIGEIQDTAFTLGRDNNSFYHSASSDENSGFYNASGYNLLYGDYKKLMSHAMDEGTKNYLKEKISGAEGWNGSCYGIATTLGLVYNKELDISDISDDDRPYIYALDKPCYDPKYRSTINYYHLLQNVNSPYDNAVSVLRNGIMPKLSISIVDIMNEIWGTPSDSEDIHNMFEQMIFYLDQNQALLMLIPSHAILVTGYEKTDSGYIFQLYDENSVDSSQPKGEIYEMTVNSELTEFNCPALNLNQDNYSEIVIMLPSDVDKNGGLIEEIENVTNIIVDTGDKFKITDSSGKELVYDGSEITTDMVIENLWLTRNDLSEGSEISLPEYQFLVDEADTYTLSELGEEADVQLYNDNGYLSLRGNNIESVEMIPGEMITLTGTDYSFTVFIDTDEEVAENETGLVAISGTATGKVVIKTSGNDITVVSENGVEDIEMNSYIENAVYPLEVPDQLEPGEEISITAKDTEDPIPENPDPEDPDPENPDPENPDPENPDPENPDPENPDPEKQNPDSENLNGESDNSDNPVSPETGDVLPGTCLPALLASGIAIIAVLCRKRRLG